MCIRDSYAGFGAFVLSAVEFLTGVWHYSAVEAGLAIAPGPLMVLPFARVVAPRLAAQLGGPGRVAVIGCAVNALSQLLWLYLMQAEPAYLTHLLPAQLLGGAGVGLAIPSLLGAGSMSLTPARFGTGSGILNTGRQVGTVLGVAGLVAILSRMSPTDPVATFQHGAVLIIAFFAAAGVVAAALLTQTARPAAAREPAGSPGEAAEAAAPGVVSGVPAPTRMRSSLCCSIHSWFDLRWSMAFPRSPSAHHAVCPAWPRRPRGELAARSPNSCSPVPLPRPAPSSLASQVTAWKRPRSLRRS